MNATKDDRSKCEPASVSLGKQTVFTSDMLYKFLRLRFLGALAILENEDNDESLYILSFCSIIYVRALEIVDGLDKGSRRIVQ